MSLMKMLSVSKSFTSGKSQPGRYKIVEQGLLPKFAPVGRPISLAPNRKSEAPSGSNSGNALQSPVTVSPVGIGTPMSAADSRPAKARAVAGFSAGAVTASAPPPATAICVNAIPASTNWFRLRKSPFTTRPAEPIRPPTPVQTELSLDAVKPVRNDLSDADLEVVPAVFAGKPSGAPKPSRRRLFQAEAAGFAWSRLAARWFNSERARI